MNPTYIEQLFVKYAKINTRSDPARSATPTTPGQTELAQLIATDLKTLDMSDVQLNPANGYVTARLPSNTARKVSAIGFIAHLDTADFNAENIQPIVHPDYDGQDIYLPGATISVAQFPIFKTLKGQRLITSDGTTLLGVDDKAGIAEIMGAMQYLLAHPEIQHGDVAIGFGPDEEIGKGAKQFDAEQFHTAFAYTLDNGRPGDIEFETFNAAQATIIIDGTAVHPGNAYHALVNAIGIAQQLLNHFPENDVPEQSQDHEGFFLINQISGTVAHAEIDVIIRDFDDAKFEQRKQWLMETIATMNQQLDQPRIQYKLHDQYHNVGTAIATIPEIRELPLKVYRDMGLTPNIVPFRGGTDGNFITQKGIPTPNLFNGGGNYHGPYEFITVEEMVTAAEVVARMIIAHGA